eukprot:m.175606 g.175606  ORF g.175606 m.175606 type:complete len:337 (-) comp15432_c1_seq2:1439-2449(-)
MMATSTSAVPGAHVANLPWVEKYRPAKLDELISHGEILSTIQRFVDEDRLPHLLLYGPPGTGKTSTIKAVAKQLYGSTYKSMTLELNASDERGIDVVRNAIKTFASTRTVFNSGFKLVILDEADAMTNDAQAALRRVIEKFTRNTRFCIICNYVAKIIPAVQSRCTRFRFAPLSEEQMGLQIDRVVKAEGLTLTPDGREGLTKLARGDMRKALNILQSTSMAHKTVDQDSVYSCTGHPLPSDIEKIVFWLLNEPIKTVYKEMKELKTNKGLALQDILYDVHEFIHRVELPAKARIFLLDKMATIEERLAAGTSEPIQMSSLIGAFVQARSLVDPPS